VTNGTQPRPNKIIFLIFSGFDIRQYVNKRTCISLTMSVAFITLIFGFLLGKFTSDRNHLIKENYKRQHEVTDRPQTVNEVDKLISSVIDAARERMSTSSEFKEQYFKDEGAKKVVSALGKNFTTCFKEFLIDDDEEDLEDFLKHILRNYYNLYLKCANELRSILLLEDAMHN
jgi:hypothetical protein